MTRETVRQHLIRLRDLIREEREHAKNMDLEAMARLRKEKEALIQVLDTVKDLHPDDHEYARQVRMENRRNAYLFKSTLNWIQETMEFFGRRTVPAIYGQTGQTMAPPVNGRLLSGKI
ncbi:flagellar protein FlgN [Desulfolithobacter sp.]